MRRKLVSDVDFSPYGEILRGIIKDYKELTQHKNYHKLHKKKGENDKDAIKIKAIQYNNNDNKKKGQIHGSSSYIKRGRSEKKKVKSSPKNVPATLQTFNRRWKSILSEQTPVDRPHGRLSIASFLRRFDLHYIPLLCHRRSLSLSIYILLCI